MPMNSTADTPANNQLQFKRLCNKCLTLGPYLQKQHCADGELYFDSLAECATPKADPAKRKYYGWILQVTVDEQGCRYRYRFGINTPDSDWDDRDVPKKYTPGVLENLQRFIERLAKLLDKEFGLALAPAAGLLPAEELKEAKAK